MEEPGNVSRSFSAASSAYSSYGLTTISMPLNCSDLPSAAGRISAVVEGTSFMQTAIFIAIDLTQSSRRHKAHKEIAQRGQTGQRQHKNGHAQRNARMLFREPLEITHLFERSPVLAQQAEHAEGAQRHHAVRQQVERDGVQVFLDVLAVVVLQAP